MGKDFQRPSHDQVAGERQGSNVGPWVLNNIIHDMGMAEEVLSNVLPLSNRGELLTMSAWHLVDGAVRNSIKVGSVTLTLFSDECFC